MEHRAAGIQAGVSGGMTRRGDATRQQGLPVQEPRALRRRFAPRPWRRSAPISCDRMSGRS